MSGDSLSFDANLVDWSAISSWRESSGAAAVTFPSTNKITVVLQEHRNRVVLGFSYRLVRRRPMRVFPRFWLTFLSGAVCLLSIASPEAFAAEWVEVTGDGAGNVAMRIPSMDRREKIRNKRDVPDPNGPYMVLSCRGSTFSISFNWREPVGKLREKRRHLFYHVDGDSHLMLPVLENTGQSTGYVDQSAKAKVLVHEILISLKRDLIPVGVFPAGRDEVSGEWIDAWFPADAFTTSALAVGKTCSFDPTHTVPSAHTIDKVAPARPGS